MSRMCSTIPAQQITRSPHFPAVNCLMGWKAPLQCSRCTDKIASQLCPVGQLFLDYLLCLPVFLYLLSPADSLSSLC